MEGADPLRRVESLATDRLSGASEIARAAAETLAGLAPAAVRPALESLVRGHPSMAPLWRLASDILSDPTDGAARFLTRLDDRAALRHMADVARDQGFERVLTISWSSSVVAALSLMKPASVLCMESQPGGEGSRTAAAIERFCRTDLIADDDALENVPADAVITGADAVTPVAVINKVKTRALAEAAGSKGVPRYAIAGEAKFEAADLPPEEALEAVPVGSFTAVASPWGLLSPQDASVRARAAPLHPALVRLLRDLTKGP